MYKLLHAVVIILMMLGVTSSCASAASKKKTRSTKAAKNGKSSAKNEEKGTSEASNPGARGFNLLTVESIDKRLGENGGLSDQQKGEILALRNDLKKKYINVNNSAEVQEAKEAVKKAGMGKDKDKLKEARALLEKATGGFVASEEYQKGLKEILDEKQFEALKTSRKKKVAESEKTKSSKEKSRRKS